MLCCSDAHASFFSFQRVIRNRSQSMDAMGLSNKKPHTVSTSHSGSFTHNPPETPKTPGIVSMRSFWISVDLNCGKDTRTWCGLKQYASYSLCQSSCPLIPLPGGVAAGICCALRVDLTLRVLLSSWHICADGRPGLLLPFLIFIISPLKEIKTDV